ncbi:MAG: SatD family protein [Pseudomonadota bacterium]
MAYIALIGDMVASKSLPDSRRAEVQTALADSLAALNRGRKRLGIASNFTITLGDEFQALFASADALWLCLFRIERDLYPTDLRFALGVGEIVTQINQKSALGMDGPAFHRARDGIELLRERNDRYGVFGLTPEPPYLNDTLTLISRQRETWKQARIETFVDTLAGHKPAAIANRLGLSPQAIYKNITDGNLTPIQRILEQCSADLNQALPGAGQR